MSEKTIQNPTESRLSETHREALDSITDGDGADLRLTLESIHEMSGMLFEDATGKKLDTISRERIGKALYALSVSAQKLHGRIDDAVFAASEAAKPIQ